MFGMVKLSTRVSTMAIKSFHLRSSENITISSSMVRRDLHIVFDQVSMLKKISCKLQIFINPTIIKKSSQSRVLWNKFRDQNSIVLLDCDLSHDFIFVELAQKMRIHIKKSKTTLEAMGDFKGKQAPLTPLIEKLHIHIQNSMDEEGLYIFLFSVKNVILRAPWFHRVACRLEYYHGFIVWLVG